MQEKICTKPTFYTVYTDINHSHLEGIPKRRSCESYLSKTSGTMYVYLSTKVFIQIQLATHYLPITQIGFRMNLSLPQKPMYFDLQPADHSLMLYSRPKNVTRHISIQNKVSFASVSYSLMVESTLKIRQISTAINLKKKERFFFEATGKKLKKI